jgi:hypothetical protein
MTGRCLRLGRAAAGGREPLARSSRPPRPRAMPADRRRLCHVDFFVDFVNQEAIGSLVSDAVSPAAWQAACRSPPAPTGVPAGLRCAQSRWRIHATHDGQGRGEARRRRKRADHGGERDRTDGSDSSTARPRAAAATPNVREGRHFMGVSSRAPQPGRSVVVAGDSRSTVAAVGTHSRRAWLVGPEFSRLVSSMRIERRARASPEVTHTTGAWRSRLDDRKDHRPACVNNPGVADGAHRAGATSSPQWLFCPDRAVNSFIVRYLPDLSAGRPFRHRASACPGRPLAMPSRTQHQRSCAAASRPGVPPHDAQRCIRLQPRRVDADGLALDEPASASRCQHPA